jgi:hypothetical protein
VVARAGELVGIVDADGRPLGRALHTTGEHANGIEAVVAARHPSCTVRGGDVDLDSESLRPRDADVSQVTATRGARHRLVVGVHATAAVDTLERAGSRRVVRVVGHG